MAKSVLTIIANETDFAKLESLEKNIKAKDALTPEVERALRAKYADLGRGLVEERTGLDLEDLTPAEEKIVEAVAKYVGLQKRGGKTANRTFQMLANRGLIEAAEASVSKTKPTQGYEVLEDAGLEELSFEQIIVDHPDEFSPRSNWYARRTLGLPNDSDKPPASSELITQVRTDKLIEWYRRRLMEGDGNLSGHTNAEVGEVLGFKDLTRHGRVLGNITSRLDFACYRCDLPPLGLTADIPFEKAWNQANRSWAFPVADMAAAAKARHWSQEDLGRVLAETQNLPGLATIPWQRELGENPESVKAWAFGLKDARPEEASPNLPEDVVNDVENMAELERQSLNETPKAKLKTSRSIERGPMGARVKKANDFKCQICEALGQPAHSFLNKDGVPYIEAHHVTPVSELQIGTLAASNIMTLCANHHRQMHYGEVSVEIKETSFEVSIDRQVLTLRRHSIQ